MAVVFAKYVVLKVTKWWDTGDLLLGHRGWSDLLAYPKSVKDNLTDKETAIHSWRSNFMDNNLFDDLVAKKLELSNVKKLKQAELQNAWY